ncbi:MAG: phosphatase PAP2 family protein [Gemmatimonadales bacterium]
MMRRLTHLGGARVTLGIGLALTALGGAERRVGLAALAGNAFSHLLVQVLKRTVRRPRPCGPEGELLALIDLPDPFSFPSGHAAAAFAVAVPAAVLHPLLAPVTLTLAAMVAWSRVALRVHWPGDALAGAALGTLGAAAALLVIS